MTCLWCGVSAEGGQHTNESYRLVRGVGGPLMVVVAENAQTSHDDSFVVWCGPLMVVVQRTHKRVIYDSFVVGTGGPWQRTHQRVVMRLVGGVDGPSMVEVAGNAQTSHNDSFVVALVGMGGPWQKTHQRVVMHRRWVVSS
jgi:hypothetical protein